MIRKHQRIRKHYVLPPPCRENDHLRDIVTGQGFDALVHLLRLLPVAVKPHNAELGLYLSGVDLDDPDARCDELFAEGIGEGAHGGFGSAVDAATLVGLTASDGADVYDVAAPAVGARLEYGKNSLGHVDETGDVGGEHNVDVFLLDSRRLSDALDQTPSLLSVYPRDYISFVLGDVLTHC